jgi:hypothetical protein
MILLLDEEPDNEDLPTDLWAIQPIGREVTDFQKAICVRLNRIHITFLSYITLKKIGLKITSNAKRATSSTADKIKKNLNLARKKEIRAIGNKNK